MMVMVEDKTVSPNANGDFSVSITKPIGVHDIDIMTNQYSESRRFVFLQGYVDMETHWAKQTVAKMRHLDLALNSTHFNPTNKTKKIEFLRQAFQVLNKFKQLPYSGIVVNQEILDLDNESDKKIVSYFVNNNIVSLDNSLIHPNKLISRAEVITILVRLFELTSKNNDQINVEDVNAHWVSKYVKIAIDNNLIRDNKLFYPKNTITNAEMITVFSRLPKVRKLFENEF